MKVGDFCKLKEGAQLEDIFPDKFLNYGKVYRIREIKDWQVSLVGVNEERFIENVGMTPTSYFPMMYFELINNGR